MEHQAIRNFVQDMKTRESPEVQLRDRIECLATDIHQIRRDQLQLIALAREKQPCCICAIQ